MCASTGTRRRDDRAAVTLAESSATGVMAPPAWNADLRSARDAGHWPAESVPPIRVIAFPPGRTGPPGRIGPPGRNPHVRVHRHAPP